MNIPVMSSEQVVSVSNENWKSEVEQSKLPVVVDFWAAWCGPCRMVSPIIDALGKKYHGKIKVVKVNVDDNQELAMKYGIMSIPTIMLFNGGKAIDTTIGAAPADYYEKFLKNNKISL
jgi:thioredoxin 1